jgi:hypothetical protein
MRKAFLYYHLSDIDRVVAETKLDVKSIPRVDVKKKGWLDELEKVADEILLPLSVPEPYSILTRTSLKITLLPSLEEKAKEFLIQASYQPQEMSQILHFFPVTAETRDLILLALIYHDDVSNLKRLLTKREKSLKDDDLLPYLSYNALGRECLYQLAKELREHREALKDFIREVDCFGDKELAERLRQL